MEALPWRRRWIEEGEPLALDDLGLLPFEGSWLEAANPGLIHLDELRDEQCLILIGEPGAGKTHALEAASGGLNESLTADSGAEVLCYDLGEAVGRDEVRAGLFSAEPLLRLREGEHTLHLFLDALDEAKIHVEKLTALLRTELRKLPHERLRLRVACRTAERLPQFERDLAQLFGEKHVRVFELAPLSRDDVDLAARARGVDASEFMRQIAHRDVGAFAAKPLTLLMLLDIFASEGVLPTSLIALYRRGLRLLCAEHDREREPADVVLTADERYAVSCRLAAASVLTGSDRIAWDTEIGPRPGLVTLRSVTGGNERNRMTAIADEISLREPAVQETLRSGLFTNREPGVVGWAHRSFGDFLSAEWLAVPRTAQQVTDLVCQRDGNELRVVPQLESVAAWFASLQPTFAESLHPADAIVALQGDPGTLTADSRRALFIRGLAAVADGALDRGAVRRFWPKLAYNEMADDLADVIADRARVWTERQAAVEAAREMHLRELEPLLAEVATTRDDDFGVRLAAVHACEDFGGTASRQALRTLAVDPDPVDVDDELKGLALAVCWPAALSTAELFDALTLPRSDTIGSYHSFLLRDVVPHVESRDDLLLALSWAARPQRGHFMTDPVSQLADEILVKAWPLAANDEGLLDAITGYAEHAFSTHTRLLMTAPSVIERDADPLEHPETRRGVAARLLGRAGDAFPVARIAGSGLLRNDEDFAWVVARRAETTDEMSARWLELAGELFVRGIGAEAAYDLRDDDPELRELTSWRYEAVLVDSPQAVRQRSQWEEHRALVEPPEDELVDSAAYDRRVADAIAAFEAGEVDGFWQAQMWLFLDDRGFTRGEHWRADLRATPGWARVGPELRERLIQAAEVYIAQGEPGEPHRSTRKMLRPAWAGYRALQLLYAERPERFAALTPDDLLRWVPIIVSWPRTDEEPREFANLILSRVNELDVARVATVVDERLASGAIHGELTLALSDLEAIWSQPLERVLLSYLEETAIPSHDRARLLRRLLEQGSTEALQVAEAHLTGVDLNGETGRTAAVDFAEVLADESADARWPLLWTLIEAHDAFGEALIGRLASMHATPLLDKLDPAALAALWRWLLQHFPPDNELLMGAGPVTPAVEVQFWRGRLTEAIARQGTRHAVTELTTLAQEFPEHLWLRRLAHEGDIERRRTEWVAPSPEEVVRLGTNPHARYVPDAPALRALVLNSLACAQDEMHAHLPLAPDFWNTKPNRPKTENEISDRLARFLRDHIGQPGVVVNREVQINPRPGGRSGERTDIHVEALDSDGERLLTVVEVKGAWNPDLDNAMSNQLIARYLVTEPAATGIYLVAWEDPRAWTAHDHNEKRRRNRAMTRTAEETRAFFEHQAKTIDEADVAAFVLDISLQPAVLEHET